MLGVDPTLRRRRRGGGGAEEGKKEREGEQEEEETTGSRAHHMCLHEEGHDWRCQPKGTETSLGPKHQ